MSWCNPETAARPAAATFFFAKPLMTRRFEKNRAAPSGPQIFALFLLLFLSVAALIDP
jgi:hypothetical protein